MAKHKPIPSEPGPGILPKPGRTAHARAKTISHATPAAQWFGSGSHPVESASTRKASPAAKKRNPNLKKVK